MRTNTHAARKANVSEQFSFVVNTYAYKWKIIRQSCIFADKPKTA